MKYDFRVLLGLALGGVALAFAPIADVGETGHSGDKGMQALADAIVEAVPNSRAKQQ